MRNETFNLGSDKMSDKTQVAKTILCQIRTGDKWALAACGARDYVADENGVTFRVSITSARVRHYITITLTPADTYTVERIYLPSRGKQANRRIVEETVEGVYCDNLAEIVYSLCHKK